MIQLPLVAIVILNYNGRNYLEEFLPSVLVSTYQNFKIVIADNASTDDSVAFLKEKYSTIELIILKQNYGFAEGYNQALQRVEADYYVLLNSDVKVESGWIEPIVTMMEADPKVGICQPVIRSFKKPQQFEYAGAAGGWIDYLGYPFARGRVFDHLETDKGQYSDSATIFWATGAAMFIKTGVYHELGGLYGFFFAHQEEIDLCWRAQNVGYKIACCTEAIVYHVGGGTLPKGHRKTYLNFRNSLIMLARNLRFREKIWKIPFRVILDGVFAAKCLFAKDFTSVKAIWNAHMSFYGWCIKINKKGSASPRSMKELNGVSNKSLVWQYFILKKKIFEDFGK